MKFCILTTNTIHHAYFISEIEKIFDISYIVYETDKLNFSYKTESNFGKLEESFENFFFNQTEIPDKFKSPVVSVSSVNSKAFKRIAENYEADFAIVFGCGKIQPHVFELFHEGMINVHRGISKKYRGLDSDLWAIYENDFDNIGVTLHYIDEDLDTGPIIFEGGINIPSSIEIFQLRAYTTLLATEQIIEIIYKKFNKVNFNLIPQKPGRYFSAMPSKEKEECEKILKRYVSNNQ